MPVTPFSHFVPVRKLNRFTFDMYLLDTKGVIPLTSVNMIIRTINEADRIVEEKNIFFTILVKNLLLKIVNAVTIALIQKSNLKVKMIL